MNTTNIELSALEQEALRLWDQAQELELERAMLGAEAQSKVNQSLVGRMIKLIPWTSGCSTDPTPPGPVQTTA